MAKKPHPLMTDFNRNPIMIDDDELDAERQMSQERCPELWNTEKLREDLAEARLALWMVAKALVEAYPNDAPWRDEWCHDTKLTLTISLLVSDVRAVIEESGYWEFVQKSGK